MSATDFLLDLPYGFCVAFVVRAVWIAPRLLASRPFPEGHFGRTIWMTLTGGVFFTWAAPAAVALTRAGADVYNVCFVVGVALLYVGRAVVRFALDVWARWYKRRHPDQFPETASVEIPAMPASLSKDPRYTPWLS